MKITVFGSTGSLGTELLSQCLEAHHDVTVLVRTESKISPDVRKQITLVAGDGLDPDAVGRALEGRPQGVLFAVGVGKSSPEDLCTDVTRNILASMQSPTRSSMRGSGGRLVWCGGGSNIVEDDVVTFGSRFVEVFASTFLGLRQRDKAHQLELLERSRDVDWAGVRPLQMRRGPKRGEYRLGFHSYSGFSSISFADCAHAMIGMLTDDTWRHKAPILQY